MSGSFEIHHGQMFYIKPQFPRHVADYGVCKHSEVGGACAPANDGVGSGEGGPMLLLHSRLAARSCVITRLCATWSPAGELSPGGEFVPSGSSEEDTNGYGTV